MKNFGWAQCNLFSSTIYLRFYKKSNSTIKNYLNCKRCMSLSTFYSIQRLVKHRLTLHKEKQGIFQNNTLMDDFLKSKINKLQYDEAPIRNDSFRIQDFLKKNEYSFSNVNSPAFYKSYQLLLVLMQANKKYKIQLYSPPWYGHMIPLAKFAQLVVKNMPNVEVKYLTFQFARERLAKEFKTVNFEYLYPDYTLEDQEKLNESDPAVMFSFVYSRFEDYLDKKKDFPDLIIGDMFAVAAMKFAKKNNITLLLNFPNSYGTLPNLFNLVHLDRAYNIEGFLIHYQLPKIDFLKPFDEILDAIRGHGRIVFQSFPGLDEACIMPPNHTFVGLLPNRPTCELTPELAKWIVDWKSKGKDKFLYVSFGSILKLSYKFANRLAAIFKKLGYPTIWSLRGPKGQPHKIDDPLIFHRQWLPQEAILRLPEVRGYMTHCGWGSITEAITTKTPLICIPAFADQPMNAKLLANKKIGVVVFDSDNFRIPEQYDVEISEERFYNGITAVFEDETYYKAIERLNKMSSYNNAADNICNVIKQALEFGHAHLFNPLFENANVKTGAPLSKILKPEFLPPNAQ